MSCKIYAIKLESDLGNNRVSSESEDTRTPERLTTIVEEDTVEKHGGELLMRVEVSKNRVNRIHSDTQPQHFLNSQQDPHIPTRFRDFLGSMPQLVTVSANGWGLFPCPESGVAVWVVHDD